MKYEPQRYEMGITFTRPDEDTTEAHVVLKNKGKRHGIGRGSAIVAKGDTYDHAVGKRIALTRALVDLATTEADGVPFAYPLMDVDVERQIRTVLGGEGTRRKY